MRTFGDVLEDMIAGGLADKIAIDDGGSDWHPETLLKEMENDETGLDDCDKVLLLRASYEGDFIFLYKRDDMRLWRYRVKHGVWTRDNEFEEGGE